MIKNTAMSLHVSSAFKGTKCYVMVLVSEHSIGVIP